jgi:hypothetical protein
MIENKIQSILEEGRCIPNLLTERMEYFIVVKNKDDKEKLSKDLIEAYEQIDIPGDKPKIAGYRVRYDIEKDRWICECRGFIFHGTCSHIEASKRTRDKAIENLAKEVN